MISLLSFRSPALGIAWEIWRRNRAGMLTLTILLLSAGAIHWTLVRNSQWNEVAQHAGYLLLVAALFVTGGFFHFTEGRRKGGFGSFPQRLFNLPVGTRWLVAVPMVGGCVAIVGVYLAATVLIFMPLGESLPIVWPCLYLVASLVIFQTIVWSIPERRYTKILCLSLAAAVICFGWMFFLPHVIEGTLSELGYAGSARSFQTGLMIALGSVGPAAYGVSVWRVRQQRHAAGHRSQGFSAVSEWITHHFLLRTRPFRSARQAVFWYEWRRTGFILPIAVGAVLALTCLPAWLSGPLSGRATVGILSWVFVSPIVLAMIIGCGLSKFDFWHPDLKMSPFAAVRPISPGHWVLTKLEVALRSVAITWAGVVLVSFLLVAEAGDLGGLDQLYRQLRIHYSPVERWLLLALALFGALMLTWRFLVNGLAIGLSARKGWYYAFNSLCAIALATCFFLVIWRSDRSDHSLHLYDLWPWLVWLPMVLAGAVLAKVGLAAWAWLRVSRLHLLSPCTVSAYFGAWAITSGLLVVGMSVAVSHTPWLRSTLILLSLLVIPLAGPALAMLALGRNRSGS